MQKSDALRNIRGWHASRAKYTKSIWNWRFCTTIKWKNQNLTKVRFYMEKVIKIGIDLSYLIWKWSGDDDVLYLIFQNLNHIIPTIIMMFISLISLAQSFVFVFTCDSIVLELSSTNYSGVLFFLSSHCLPKIFLSCPYYRDPSALPRI